VTTAQKTTQTKLSSGKWVVPQNLTIGDGSLSDRNRKVAVVPKGLEWTRCQIVKIQGVLDERVASSLIKRRTCSYIR